MYAAHKPHFPELESPEMKTSPSSYESPDHIGADKVGATGLGLGTAPPSYRGTSAGGQNPGDATRLNRQSELPGSPGFPPGTASPEVVNQRTADNDGIGGGLRVVNPTQEPSELPASTYHAYMPYRPPGS